MALVGRSVPRPDGPAKVTGRARYVDDVTVPGTWVGATLRSTVPRGRLRGIVKDASFDWSGLTVVTAENVPANVVSLIEEDQPVLASDDVRHVGEPLALVAGADALTVQRALRHLRADIEPLPAVLSVPDALARTAQIYGSDNLFRTVRIAKGDAAAAIAACPVQLSGTYATPHQEHVYLEPQGVLAYWDASGGAHVLSSCQCPYYIHKGIKRTFGLTDERVDVTQAVTGGGFGGKEEYPTILALHALLLARASGRPVKMVYDRKEDIEATTKRHPSVVTVTSGCDRDGTLRAVSIRIVLDGGAYVTLSPVVLSRGALHAAGAYRWEHVSIEAQAVATNTPPNGAFRGFGAPQTIWAIERHMDRIARTLRIDPLALREKNLLRVGDTTPTGQFLKESVGVARCVEEAKKASRWEEKRRAAAPAQNAAASGMFRLPPPGALAPRKARGIGASVYLHGAGFTGSGELVHRARVAIDLLAEAGTGRARFRIRGASTDIGQGTETVFRQIAAEALWVSMDRVEFATPSTAHVPDSGPTVASRTVMVVGGVVEAAARALFSKIEGDRQKNGGSFDDAAARLLAAAGDAHGRAGIRAAARPRVGRRDLPGRRVPGLRLGLRDRGGRGGPRHVRDGRPGPVERARRRQGDPPDPLQGPDRGRAPAGGRLGAPGEPRDARGPGRERAPDGLRDPDDPRRPAFHDAARRGPLFEGSRRRREGARRDPDGRRGARRRGGGRARDRNRLRPPAAPPRGPLGAVEGGEAVTTRFTLNGRPASLEAPPAARLLDVLRGPLGLTGTKEGCGEGECGSCTVLLDGAPVNACLVLLGQVEGRSVTTVEGLGDPAGLSPLQEAFVKEGGSQCGICTPGFLVSAEALLAAIPQPGETDIREALAGNLCRCTGYQRIVEAVRAATKERASREPG